VNENFTVDLCLFSFTGLSAQSTKYSTNLVNTGVLEGAITEWE